MTAMREDARDATCAFCFVALPEHPEPLCSPGVVRELRAELAEACEKAETQGRLRRATHRDFEQARAELANVQRRADTWKDAADGWEERAERLTAERDELRQRADQAEAAATEANERAARVERLRDKWLTYPTGDMHHAAGLMLAKHLSGEAFALDASTAPAGPCSLCGDTGIVPGTEEPEINASGEPCDCQIRPTAAKSPGGNHA